MPELQQFNQAQADRLEKDIDQVKIQIQSAEDRKIYLEGQLATVKPDSPIISATGERVQDPSSRLIIWKCSCVTCNQNSLPIILTLLNASGKWPSCKTNNASGGSPSLKGSN